MKNFSNLKTNLPSFSNTNGIILQNDFRKTWWTIFGETFLGKMTPSVAPLITLHLSSAWSRIGPLENWQIMLFRNLQRQKVENLFIFSRIAKNQSTNPFFIILSPPFFISRNRNYVKHFYALYLDFLSQNQSTARFYNSLLIKINSPKKKLSVQHNFYRCSESFLICR